MKINQLKAAVEKYKDREDLALLVTDRCVHACHISAFTGTWH